jgi:hypothetical protein
MSHASDDEVLSVKRDAATAEVLAYALPAERALYLYHVLGHKKSAIIRAGVIAANRFRRALIASSAGRKLGQVGRPTFLHTSTEDLLSAEIKKAQDSGHPLTKDSIYHWVCQIGFFIPNVFFLQVEEHLDYTPKQRNPNSRLSTSYPYNFMRRHPELHLQTTVPLDLARTIASTQETLSPWFNLFLHTLSTYKIIPQLLLNIDETALFVNDLRTPKAFTHEQSSTIPITTTSRRLPTATVLFTICADHSHLPTVILWPRKSLPPEFPAKSDELIFIPNGSGWQTKDSFYLCMSTVLVPAIVARRNRIQPAAMYALLLLDSHSSRCSSKLLQLCADNKIILLTIPPHTSHLVQPLDRAPNGAMKRVLREELARAAAGLDGQYRALIRQQLQVNPYEAASSCPTAAPVSAFANPFTPPASPSQAPPISSRADPLLSGVLPKPLSAAARERQSIALALPHVFARALAEPVVQAGWELSGLWPPNKDRVCSRLPAVYTGPQPPVTTRTSLLPAIGGRILNAPGIIEQIRTREQAHGMHPPPGHTVTPPKITHSIVYDDDDSSGSDLDPISLELVLEEDAKERGLTGSAMELEPPPEKVDILMSTQIEEVDDADADQAAGEAAIIEFCSDSEDLLP